MPRLQLVCQPSWMRDEMSEAGIDLYHSYGLEVPYFDYEDIWWMPQGFAVELNRSLIHHNKQPIELLSPGNHLLPSVPTKFTGRRILALTVEDALANPQEGWWKSAEAKIDTFTSQHRTATSLVDDINESSLPLNSVLHYTPTILDISREYRSFISNGRVLTTSIYLVIDGDEQTTVYDGALALPGDIERVESFLASVLNEVDIPPSVVVDTAILASGDLALLEFNPSWCSAWYSNDILDVVESINAGFHCDDSVRAKWSYTPDSYLVNKAARRSVIPVR